MRERYTFVGVLLFSIVAVGLGIMLPGEQKEKPLYLPWMIEKTEGGSIRVLGLELGKSTLYEAQQRFQEVYEVTLFAHPDGSKVVEAYFDQTALNGFRARVVLVMKVSPEQLEDFYQRGVRIATLGSGTRKVTLADTDLKLLTSMPFDGLTYIPRANLTAELVEARFGTPAQRIRKEGKEGVVEHWLYPEKGLDLSLHENGKEVLQYVVPTHFEELRKPLQVKGDLLSD
ncbi:MAG: hypothetical protein OEZ16_05835 [Chromatiales bacterium]|nr:hypothetical protein [Chromatiales bacterium]